MKLIFAGTPEFAAEALQALIAAGHEVLLVLTQPDRQAGRGLQLMPSAVKQVALQHSLPLHQPEKLKDPATHAPIRDAVAAGAEVMVVAAYGLILPQAVLDLPPRGCLNIHASLLPRWRGAAPIHRAIEAGDTETGITLMQMDAGLDTGAMLLKASLPIASTDTTGQLHDKLAAQGARLIVEALPRLDTLTSIPQPNEGVSYAAKISKSEALLDWNLPATVLDRRIRAFNPFPVAQTILGQAPDVMTLKIWGCAPTEGQGQPGTVLVADADRLVVACGQGALQITELQKPGGKRLPIREFLAGFPLAPGVQLGG